MSKRKENRRVHAVADYRLGKRVQDSGRQKPYRRIFDWAYNGHGYYSASDSPVAREEIPPDLSFSDIKDFISKKPYSMSRAESRDYDDKKELARVKDNRKQLRRNTAIKLFNRYLQEGLALDEQKRLTETWNLKANSLVNPDFSKMPVFVDGMSTHKGSKDFTLMDQQMKEISMLINKEQDCLRTM